MVRGAPDWLIFKGAASSLLQQTVVEVDGGGTVDVISEQLGQGIADAVIHILKSVGVIGPANTRLNVLVDGVTVSNNMTFFKTSVRGDVAGNPSGPVYMHKIDDVTPDWVIVFMGLQFAKSIRLQVNNTHPAGNKVQVSALSNVVLKG